VSGRKRARVQQLAQHRTWQLRLSPGDLAVLDPLGIGPSRLATDYFSQYPTPNDPGIDGLNLVGYRFAAPIQNTFNTGIAASITG
jgi:hypothetical protein